MKVTKHEQGEKFLVKAEASPDDVAFVFSLAARGFANKMGITPEPGTPLEQTIKSRTGITDLDAVVASQAEELLVPMAIEKTGIDPAFQPTASSREKITRGKAHPFTFSLLPKPTYELSSYDPVDITIPAFKEPDQLVEAQLRQIQETYADFEPDEARPVKAGDAVKIALEAKSGETRIDGLCTDGRVYQMGMGILPADFDAQIEGMDVGQTKEFSIGDGSTDGLGIECSVTILEMQRRVISDIDDEFVGKYLPFYRNAGALKAAVREQVLADYRRRYEEMKVGAATAELVKRFEGSISDQIYEQTQRNVIGNLQIELAAQGIPFDQFVQQQGGQDQFGMMAMFQARQMLVEGYSLDALARHEKITVQDSDIDEVCAGMDPTDPAAMRRQMEQGGLGYSLREAGLRLRAGRYVAEHANVTIDQSNTFV